MQALLLSASLFIAAAGILLAGARLWWNATTRQLRDRLAAASTGPAGDPHDADLASSPLPVQRYLRRALPRNPRRVAAVRIRHVGEFNLSETGERWVPFSSTQYVVLRRPGFDWDARLRLAPGLAVWVRDGCYGGEGRTEARLLALWPLVSLREGGRLAAGQRMRFLAEAPWYPVLLLPGHGVRWSAAGERRAVATLADAAPEVSLLFTFSEDDFVLAVETQARPRMSGSGLIPTPWQGRFWRYAERNGFWIPLEGEVSWLLPDGPHPYWRGRIVSIDYQASP